MFQKVKLLILELDISFVREVKSPQLPPVNPGTWSWLMAGGRLSVHCPLSLVHLCPMPCTELCEGDVQASKCPESAQPLPFCGSIWDG